MATDKTPPSPPVTIEGKVETHGELSRESDNNNQAKSSSQFSPNMQLLTLAKKFAIDGSLLPSDKQMPLEERFRKRARVDDLRKQQNLEAIIQRAMQYCASDEISDRADADWFANFLELAENVGNKTMQDLWAKILAGEVCAPASFSIKSLKAFRTMSIHEAKLFAKACSLAVKDSSRKNYRIISSASQTPGLFHLFSGKPFHPLNLASFGLSYAELMTLADNHLIFLQETETTPYKRGEELKFDYNGQPLTLIAQKNNCLISFYKFTPVGVELARLIADKPDDKFAKYMTKEFSGLFTVS